MIYELSIYANKIFLLKVIPRLYLAEPLLSDIYVAFQKKNNNDLKTWGTEKQN
jgi:hypothetical protein